LALQATPLILFPRVIISMLSSEMHKYPTRECPAQYRHLYITINASALETYFSRTLGFALLAIAVISVLMTGLIPLSTASEPISLSDADPKAPYAIPTILVTTVFHTVCSIYLYTWYSASGQAGFLLGLLGYAGLATLGLWYMMFGSGPGSISKRTGADKRTAGFPFKNVESDKKKVGKKRI
jgi:hypothetical protein